MKKVKLAICIQDEEYEARFVKCVMNHYKESYEIYVLDSISELVKQMEKMDGVIIAGDGDWLSQCSFEKQENVIFVLQENMEEKMMCMENGIFLTEKYQEVYKVMEQVEKQVTKDFSKKVHSMDEKETQWIGVFSLENEVLQIPFTALLAEILGETKQVLVIDIQPYSGFEMEIDADADVLGMEDVMAVTATGVYTNSRLAASIGHEQRWDYIYPVKNVQCLAEADVEQYKTMIRLLQKERGYEHIIINFGAIFSGVTELIRSCDQVYFLTGKPEETNWREKEFHTKMGIGNGDNFLEKIIWMEMPVCSIRGKTWRMLVKEWLWNDLGDKLREINWLVNTNG